MKPEVEAVLREIDPEGMIARGLAYRAASLVEADPQTGIKVGADISLIDERPALRKSDRAKHGAMRCAVRQRGTVRFIFTDVKSLSGHRSVFYVVECLDPDAPGHVFVKRTVQNIKLLALEGEEQAQVAA